MICSKKPLLTSNEVVVFGEGGAEERTKREWSTRYDLHIFSVSDFKGLLVSPAHSQHVLIEQINALNTFILERLREFELTNSVLERRHHKLVFLFELLTANVSHSLRDSFVLPLESRGLFPK